jgi:pimeloyl-ACP methyl ester carboxylesterase
MKVSPEDKYLDINGLRFHYLEWGKSRKQTMLLLHGFMGHAHVWDEFALRFRDHYHIIALDQRGHGESDWSKDLFYSIDAHYLDLANFINILGLNPLILIGHSMGGRNALFYTFCHPENVERLVLIDVRPSSDPKSSRALREHIKNLPVQAESLEEIVRALKRLYPYLSNRACRCLASYGYRKEGDGRFISRFDARMSLKLDRLGCITEDLRPYLKNIACPTLVIRGEESPFLSRVEARRMCESLQKPIFKEIRASSHMPFQENPKAFYKEINDFLGLGIGKGFL